MTIETNGPIRYPLKITGNVDVNKNITFAIDQNLKLDVDDPIWKKFFQRFNITPLFYTDMKLLTEKMQENTVHLAYLPTANFFLF